MCAAVLGGRRNLFSNPDDMPASIHVWGSPTSEGVSLAEKLDQQGLEYTVLCTSSQLSKASENY